MIIGRVSTAALVPPYVFAKPVAVHHFAVVTAITDATDVGLADAVAPADRVLQFVVRTHVLTNYANGDGSSPILQLQTDKGAAMGQVTLATVGATAGTFTTHQGTLAPGERLILHPTAGTGTTETGTSRITITVMDPNPPQ